MDEQKHTYTIECDPLIYDLYSTLGLNVTLTTYLEIYLGSLQLYLPSGYYDWIYDLVLDSSKDVVGSEWLFDAINELETMIYLWLNRCPNLLRLYVVYGRISGCNEVSGVDKVLEFHFDIDFEDYVNRLESQSLTLTRLPYKPHDYMFTPRLDPVVLKRLPDLKV